MTDDEIKGLFYSYGQYVSGKDFALIHAIEQVIASQRQWVGLTDEERNKIWIDVVGWGDPSHDDEDLMKALEARLKEKNGC